MRTVSVFILTKNEERNIGRCLETVFSQNLNDQVEVLVVDSGSTDRTREIVRGTKARLIEVPPGSFDHGATRQQACDEARGDYIATLAADAEPVDNNWLAALVDALDRYPQAAGAYSRQLPQPDCDPIRKRQLEQWITFGTELQCQAIASREIYEELSPLQKRLLVNFDDVSSIRRRAVLRRHPIPAAPFGQDLLWGKAVMLDGYQLVFQPASTVYHSHQRTVRYLFQRSRLDAQMLRDTFGIVNFPRFRDLIYGICHGLREGGGLDPSRKWYLAGLTAAEACGHYIGSHTSSRPATNITIRHP